MFLSLKLPRFLLPNLCSQLVFFPHDVQDTQIKNTTLQKRYAYSYKFCLEIG